MVARLQSLNETGELQNNPDETKMTLALQATPHQSLRDSFSSRRSLLKISHREKYQTLEVTKYYYIYYISYFLYNRQTKL